MPASLKNISNILYEKSEKNIKENGLVIRKDIREVNIKPNNAFKSFFARNIYMKQGRDISAVNLVPYANPKRIADNTVFKLSKLLV